MPAPPSTLSCSYSQHCIPYQSFSKHISVTSKKAGLLYSDLQCFYKQNSTASSPKDALLYCNDLRIETRCSRLARNWPLIG
nr:unnamed protein product [Spirometra erinaceieuropaei]